MNMPRTCLLSFRLGALCLSLGLAAACLGAGLTAPKILSTRKSGTNLLVSVNVPKGWRAVTLESRAHTNAGAWVPRAVTRIAGKIVFKVPGTLSTQSLRLRGQTQEPLPQSFYRGVRTFAKHSSSFWRPDQGRGEVFSLSAAGALAADLSVPASANSSRSVVESDIWKINGDTLFFFNQLRGLQVIDVQNPDTPILTGTLPMPAVGEQMYVLDAQHVVLLTRDGCSSDSQSRILVVDVSAPTPRVQAALTLEGWLVESRLVGTALYVAAQADRPDPTADSWQSGTAVASFDLSNPAAPVARSSLWFNGWNNAVLATDRWLFVARQNETDTSGQTLIRVLDISAADATMRDVAGITTAGQVADKFKMNLSGDIFTAVSERYDPEAPATGSGPWITTFETFSLAQPASPTPLGSLSFAPGERLFATRFDGTRAYAVTFLRVDPLWVIDLSDPANPEVAGSVEVPGWSTYLEPMGDRLLTLGVETNRVTLSLFNVHDPARPALLSRVPLGENDSWSEATSDEKALTVLTNLGLVLLPCQGTTSNGWASRVQLVDLSPTALTARGTIDRPVAPRRTAAHKGRVLSLSNNELLGVDISDRDHPQLTAQTELAWPANQVFVQGNYLLELAKGSGWMTATRPAVRLALATDPNATLQRVELGDWPIVGAALHNQALFLLQSPAGLYTGPVLFGGPTASGTGSDDPQNTTNLLLTVLDVSALPALQIISQTPIAGSASTPTGGSFQALWPNPDLLVWFSTGSSFWINPLIDARPIGVLTPLTTAGSFSGPGLPRIMPASSTGTSPAVGGTGQGHPSLGVQSFIALPYWRPWWSSGGVQLLALDVSHPSSPALLSSLRFNPTNVWGFSTPLASQGLVYFSHEQSGYQAGFNSSWKLSEYLDVIDYADPTTPTVRPPVNVPGQLTGLSHDGALLYLLGSGTGSTWSREALVACAYDGVAAYQVASLSLPTTWPRPVVVANDTLYLGRAAADDHTNSTVEAWNLSAQGKFGRLASAAVSQPVSALAAFGDLVVAQSANNQLHLFDAGQPAALLPCGQGGPPGCLWSDLNQATGTADTGLWIPLDDYGVTWVPRTAAGAH